MAPSQGRKDALLACVTSPFLGFGAWRAWVSLSYASPVVDAVGQHIAVKFMYDIFLVLCFVAIALFTKRLIPLTERKNAYVLCAVCMVSATLMNTVPAFLEIPLPNIGYLSAFLAAVGSALLILLWCELFSCLNPLRVAMHLSVAFIFGVILVFVLKGFKEPYLYGAMVLLPLISLLCVKNAYRGLPATEKPPRFMGRFSFPWKLIALLAIYEFAAGLRIASESQIVGSHSTLSTLVASALLFTLAFFFSDRFDFSVFYRAPGFIIACALLLISLFTEQNALVAQFILSLSVTLFSAMIFLLLCDISKRWGIAAIFLFSIEESTIIFSDFGQLVGEWFATNESSAINESVASVLIAVLVILATVLLLSERELGSKWGLSFIGKGRMMEESSEQVRLALVCADLAKTYKLTARETEILGLLAQRKSISMISRELFIADGTTKAHIRHIYEKMGIHTRNELFGLLALEIDE